MIRLRAEERRIKIQQVTGEAMLIPRAGGMIWTGIFFRMMFRVGIMAISLTALGYPVDGISNSMSGVGMAISTLSFFCEGALLIYTCYTTNLFNIGPETKAAFVNELRSDKAWAEGELKNMDNEKNFRKEFLSDIILNIYAFMLYTAWWDYVNNYAITMGQGYFRSGATETLAIISVLPMLFIMTLLALIPLRLAYWVEDSASSFTEGEKWRTRATFFIAAAITISPAIAGIHNLYVVK